MSVASVKHGLRDSLLAHNSDHKLPAVVPSRQALLFQQLDCPISLPSVDTDPVHKKDVPEVFRQFRYSDNVRVVLRIALGRDAFVEPLGSIPDGSEIAGRELVWKWMNVFWRLT